LNRGGDDVFAGDGKEFGGEGLVGMLGGIMIKARGVGFDEGAGGGFELVILGIDDLRDAEELDGIIDGGGVFAIDCGEATRGGEQGLLDGEEVVFGVGVGEAVGGVGIGMAEDVGDAPGVAEDGDVVGRCGLAEAGEVVALGPEDVEGGQGDEDEEANEDVTPGEFFEHES